MNDKAGSKWVSTNWVITILIGLVAWLGGMFVNNQAGVTKELDTRMRSSETRIERLEANYDNILKKLDKIDDKLDK